MPEDPPLPKGFEHYQSDVPSLPKGFEHYQPYQDPITKMSNTVAPLVGREAVEALPFAGSFLPIPFGGGAALGTIAKNALKTWKPELVGEPPSGVMGNVVSLVKDQLFNTILPKVVTNIGARVAAQSIPTSMQETAIKAATAPVLSQLPAVREGIVKRYTDKILQNIVPETQAVEHAAGMAEQGFGDLQAEIQHQQKLNPPTTNAQGQIQIHPDVRAAMDEMSQTFGKNTVGKQLVQLQREISAGGDVAGSQKYRIISNEMMSDVRSVRNAQIATGGAGNTQFTEPVALNKLFPGQEINAEKTLAEMTGKNKEIYQEAMDPQTYRRTQDMLTEMQKQQGGGVLNPILKYTKNRLTFSALTGGSGLLLGHPVAGLTGTGLVLTNQWLSKQMQNPAVADAVIQAMRTPANAPQAGMLVKVISHALQAGADLATVPEK